MFTDEDKAIIANLVKSLDECIGGELKKVGMEDGFYVVMTALTNLMANFAANHMGTSKIAAIATCANLFASLEQAAAQGAIKH
jgi:hypothetical protein